MKDRPTEMQEALACYMTAMVEQKRHQLWELQASIGKSIIKSVTGLRAIDIGLCTKVHHVTANLSLQHRDTEDFKDMLALAGFSNKVEHHHTLDFAVGHAQLVIIDEADRFIFSEPHRLVKLMKKCKVICLTATTTSNR